MLPGKNGNAVMVRPGHVTKVIFDRGLGGYHQPAFSNMLSCFPLGAADIMKSPWIRKRNQASVKCKENHKALL